MELTVIRTNDSRRMVVSVEARSEAEALRAIQNAVGPVTIVMERQTVRLRQPVAAGRRARNSAYF
ncbi:hypothetical protein [Leifsonia sp. LS-T14]|uniref:hypothetical protein n=1 Tax=unclassified Leifsonia TaxID=2663824 RepID=UPI0035A743E6